MDIIDRTAFELLAAIRNGELTADAVTAAYLHCISEREPKVAAFLHVDEAQAMEQATVIDRKRKAGVSLGSLAGIPIAIKDLLCTKGQPTTCGSKMLRNYVPPYDAHVIERLRQADAVLIGKTNMDEFAMGSSTENSAFHVTRNPWDLDRIPGGSSGGSATAVAASEAALAIGTDTGGSIRQPAALCGVVGLKPTYGRVSRYGLVAFASSLDQIGPFGRDVRDTAMLLEAIAGHDRRDSTSVDQSVPAYSQSVDEPVKPLTVGVAREYFGEGLDSEVEQAVGAAIEVYRGLGATIREVSLPHSRYAVAVYYIVATAEASSNLARYDGVHFGHRAKEFDSLIHMMSRSRAEGFGVEVKRRIMLGTFVLSAGYQAKESARESKESARDAYYVKALKVRRLIKEDYDRAFAECDVILGPTTPTPAFKLGEKTANPLAMYLSDIYTIGANLAGIPALSMPCGFTEAGLPIGLQLQAPPFEEDKLLRGARMAERVMGLRERRPSL